MDVLSAMWDSASADLAAEQRAHRLVAAKVSAAEVWPFLALAVSEPEFEHRLALVRDHVTAVVDPDLHDEVVASLREDFRTVAGYGDGKWDDETAEHAQRADRDQKSVDEIMRTQKYPPGQVRPYSGDDAFERHEETNPAIFDPAGDKADARRKRSARDTAREVEQGGNGRFVFDDEHDDPNHERDGEDSDAGDRSWDQHHKSSLRAATSASMWDALDAAPRHQQRLGASHGHSCPSCDSSSIVATSDPDDDQTYGVKCKGCGWSGEMTTHDGPMPPKQGRREATLTFFHEASGKWVRIGAATMSPENPNYFLNANPEQGPNTDPSGYANMYPDPPETALQRYTQPEGPWSDATPWQENPMTFSPPRNGTSGWTTPPQKTSARTAANENCTNCNGKGEVGQGDCQACGGMGSKAAQDDRRHRNGSRQKRTAKAPPMDPRDEETRSHVCIHCGEEEPRPNKPCPENGNYCSNCSGSGCQRCGNAGEVFGTHHIVTGIKRRADVDHSQQSNPGYFDQGSDGLTGAGVDTSPPPITGNPDAGVFGGGADGTATSEPLEARSDWYGEMTGQADSPDQDGTEGQNFQPQASRRPFGDSSFYDPGDRSVRVTAADMGAGMDPMDGGGAPDAAANTPQVDPTGGTDPGQDPNARVPDDVGMSSQAVREAVRRALAAGDAPAGGGPPPSSGGGQAPTPPPQMQQGGPGAEAMPPMGGTPGQPGAPGAPGGATSNVPQTTKPRQSPGAGGPPGAPGGAPPGGPTSGSAPGTPKAARRVWADARDIATPDNPTGLGDEYDEVANEGAMRQKPMQSGDARKVNTPQKARDPIPTISSPGTPGGGDDDDDDEDNTREAVRRAVNAVMAGAR